MGNSVDSRTFDSVHQGLLDALVIAVVWPFWRSRWLEIAVDEEEIQAMPERVDVRKERQDDLQELRDIVAAAHRRRVADESSEVDLELIRQPPAGGSVPIESQAVDAHQALGTALSPDAGSVPDAG